MATAVSNVSTLGSTTEKIIRHAPCPVLVVREATRGPLKTRAEGIVLEKILVPVDFSECAKEGAKYASVFATRVGANLLLTHVIHPPDYMAVEGTMAGSDQPQLIEKALLDAEDKLDEMENFLPLVGISAETQVAVGTPVDKLAEASARPDVDMVITSTHGYTGSAGTHFWAARQSNFCVWRNARCWLVPSHCRQMPQ